jgi:hypothetical protein
LTFDGEDVEGCLTAEEVFTRIKKNYIENSWQTILSMIE